MYRVFQRYNGRTCIELFVFWSGVYRFACIACEHGMDMSFRIRAARFRSCYNEVSVQPPSYLGTLFRAPCRSAGLYELVRCALSDVALNVHRSVNRATSLYC